LGCGTLDERRRRRSSDLCELIVPGSTRVGPVLYIEPLLARMPPPIQDAVRGSIESLGEVAREGVAALAPQRGHTGVPQLRALAIEAYYSDFVAPGVQATGPGTRSTSTAAPRCAQGLVLPSDSRMSERFDVVSSARVRAWRRPSPASWRSAGRSVLLLELGP